jgi:hypothetical protein
MVAMTSLNDMMGKGYMSICTIDTIAKMIGVTPEGLPAYKMLRPLHCVNFSNMPPELVKKIPELIMECLGVEPIYQFSLPRREPVTVVVDPEPVKAERRGIVRLLTGR